MMQNKLLEVKLEEIAINRDDEESVNGGKIRGISVNGDDAEPANGGNI